MAERTIILSDLHLGRPDGVAAVEALDAFVEPGATLVLNGDTAELQHPRWKDDAERQYGRLLAMAAERGTAIVALAGNHDPSIATDRVLRLADGEVLVTHGDAFHPSVAPWSKRARAMREAWARAMAEIEPARRDELASRLAAAHAAGTAEWHGDLPEHTTWKDLVARPWTLLQIATYWWRAPGLAAAFAERCAPSARFIVTGHSHWPGVRWIGERCIVNTGSFSTPGMPHAVVLEGDRLAFVAIARRETPDGLRYVLSSRPKHVLQVSGRGTATPARSSREGSDRPSPSAMPRPAASSVARSTPVASPDPSQA